MRGFKFNLGDKVKMAMSEETGVVNGRAEYATSENSYSVVYKGGDGRQVTAWWDESHLVAA